MVDLNIQIPDGFLEEEIRCDYKVTKQIKEVWAISLDLLEELKRVCAKYNLKYIADFGTLLGAVRHQGFIPWDDDIDVAMPRDDYEKLIEVAFSEFKHPYFFECFHSDPHFAYGKAKLLNMETTGYENPMLVKHGLFIDIFPLDKIIDDPILLKKQGEKMTHYFAKMQRVNTCNQWSYCIKKGISLPRRLGRFYEYFKMKLLGIKIGGYYHKKAYYNYENESRKYNDLPLSYVGDLIGYLNEPDDKILVKDFDNLIETKFEFTTITIPYHYEEILAHMYGNYNQYVVGASTHTFEIIDTDRPYTEVLKEKGIL